MLLGDSAFGIEWPGGAKFAMNYVMLTEGTGKGVHEYTNVSVLAEMCVHDDAQRVSLERGPGTKFGAIVTGRLFGLGAISIAQRHYKWLAQWHRRDEDAKIFLFGFSRGALVARMLADLICTCGIPSDAYDARRVFQWWMNGGYNEAIGAFRRERRLMPARAAWSAPDRRWRATSGASSSRTSHWKGSARRNWCSPAATATSAGFIPTTMPWRMSRSHGLPLPPWSAACASSQV